MMKQNKSTAALLAVFPTPESFADCLANSDNAHIIQSFIDYAARNNLIRKNDLQSLESFIADHARSQNDCTPPDNLNFDELIQNMRKWLKLNLSVRSLTDRINHLAKNHQIALPKVSYSMLSRLKAKPADTAYKQHALRSFAFWLGYERSDIGPVWNYETLMKLCPENKLAENYKEGVRIGIALNSRGDVIDHAVINELKTFIKNYNEQSAGHLNRGLSFKVRSYDFTTFYVDIPKESTLAGPTSYRLCIKVALSMAHQISIRWALSKYYTHNRFLSIGIVAGEFNKLDHYLLSLLKTKLPNDPVIRISDFVHQCMTISNIRVLFCQQPKEVILFNEETFCIWWITGFWGSLYFNLVPDLLKDKLLKNTPVSKKLLSQLLWFPEDTRLEDFKDDQPNAVTTFLRFPENLLLGLEIVKTLYLRRRYHHALEILRIILSTDPANLTARTLRMTIFRELALNAPSFFIANQFFEQSEYEAICLQENFEKSEDFFCEYGNIHLSKAMLILRHCRAGKVFPNSVTGIQHARHLIFEALDKADYLYNKALTISQLTIRALHLLHVARILKTILKSDEEIFTNPQKPIDGKPEIVAESTSTFRWHTGLIENDIMGNEAQSAMHSNFIVKLMVSRYNLFDVSISLPANSANHCFSHAVSLWDFVPHRTPVLIKRVLKILDDAIHIAESVAKDEICIFSSTRIQPEMMPVDLFIHHVKKCIQMVKSAAGDDFMRKDDNQIIKMKDHAPSLLMTLNF